MRQCADVHQGKRLCRPAPPLPQNSRCVLSEPASWGRRRRSARRRPHRERPRAREHQAARRRRRARRAQCAATAALRGVRSRQQLQRSVSAPQPPRTSPRRHEEHGVVCEGGYGRVRGRANSRGGGGGARTSPRSARPAPRRSVRNRCGAVAQAATGRRRAVGVARTYAARWRSFWRSTGRSRAPAPGQMLRWQGGAHSSWCAQGGSGACEEAGRLGVARGVCATGTNPPALAPRHANPPRRATARPLAEAEESRPPRQLCTCPISTEGWTRRVHFVREGGVGGGELRPGRVHGRALSAARRSHGSITCVCRRGCACLSRCRPALPPRARPHPNPEPGLVWSYDTRSVPGYSIHSLSL